LPNLNHISPQLPRGISFLLGLLVFLCFAFISKNASAQYSGTYTINQNRSASSSNFVSLGAAADSLKKHGVNGAVTINMVDSGGDYRGAVYFSKIPGASASNKIVIKSAASNSKRPVVSDGGAYRFTLLNFDSCSYLTLENIHVKVSSSGGRGIVMWRSNHHVNFKQCKIECISTTRNTRAGLDEYSPYNDAQHHIIVDGCEFSGFSYGVSFNSYQWSGGYVFDYEHQIINNTFEDCALGIHVDGSDHILIANNTIENYGTIQSLSKSGMHITGMVSGSVFRNIIRLKGKGIITGIFTSYCGGRSNDHSKIFSNYVEVDNRDSSARIIAYQDYNTIRTKFVFNTLRQFTNDDKAYAVTFNNDSRSNENTFANNIISVEEKGNLLYMDTSTYLSEYSDYNNWYCSAKDSAFDWYHELTDLAGFSKQAKGDSNSISVSNHFDTIGYHSRSGQLDGKGIPITGISTDIDGETRNSSNPDIGANEFKAAPNAAGVDSLTSSVFCLGTNSVSIQIQNFGVDTMKSATIKWEAKINNGSWSTVKNASWSGNLRPFRITSYTIGNYKFGFDSAYVFRFTISAINGKSDTLRINNPYETPILKSSLSGDYIVGDSSSDFVSLKDAFQVLEDRGICSSVRLLLKNKEFVGPFEIGFIPNTSASDTVLVTSVDTAKRAMLVSNSSTNGGEMALKLNGARNIHFDRLDFAHDSLYRYGSFVIFDNNNKHISFTNNRFILNNAFLLYALGNLKTGRLMDVRIENNHFIREGNSAYNTLRNVLFIQDHTDKLWHTKIKFNKNHIDPLRGRGITIARALEIEVISNNYTQDTFVETIPGPALELKDIRDFQISRNSFRLPIGVLVRMNNCWGHWRPGVISNNEFASYGWDNSQHRVLDLIGENIHLLYNSVSSWDTDLKGYTFRSVVDSPFYCIGNSFAHYGGGIVAFIDTGALVVHQYNNYFSTGKIQLETYYRKDSKFSYYGLTQHDSMFFEKNTGSDPYYHFPTSLIPHSSVLNDMPNKSLKPKFDINGRTRDSLHDVGCYEFDLAKNDLSVLSMTSSTICMGGTAIDFMIRNDGRDSIKNSVVSLYVKSDSNDWIREGQYAVSLDLANGDSAIISLGSYQFSGDSLYRVRLQVDSVNGFVDSSVFMNVVESDTLKTALSGEYSVGHIGDDFETLHYAIEVLHDRGVCGPVRFLVRDTTIGEPVYFGAIKGSSSDNRIEFTSHQQNSGRPRLKFASKIFYRSSSYDKSMMSFENSSFITIDSFTFENRDKDTFPTSYSDTRLIDLIGGNTGLVFSNDSFIDITIPNQPERYQTSRAHIGMEYHIENSYEGLEIEKCVFLNGVAPLNLMGYNGFKYVPKSIKVVDNDFNAYTYAINIQGVEQAEFSGNKIHELSKAYDLNANGATILGRKVIANGNEIRIRSIPYPSGSRRRVYGLNISPYLKQDIPESDFLISNNMISVLGDSSNNELAGLTVNSVNAKIYFNSINVKTKGGVYSSALNISQDNNDSTEIALWNNAISCKGEFPAIRFNSSTPPRLNADYNNYDVDGIYLYDGGVRFRGIDRLKDIQDSMGNEVHSWERDPLFTNDSNLHTASKELNHAGFRLAEVIRDIDGDYRDTVRAPDIGADEYVTFRNDVRIISADYLGRCPDTQSVYVRFINEGEDTLTELHLSWEIKRGTSRWSRLKSKYWQGNEAYGDSFTVEIGQVFLAADSLVKLRFTIDSVNRGIDSLNNMNLLTTDSFTTALPALVKVGGSGGDYSSLNSAIDALHFRGVCHPTRFEIAGGEYYEYDSIGIVHGSSKINSIKFVKDPSSTSPVRIISNWDSSKVKYVLKLQDVNYMSFDSMTFVADGTIPRSIFLLKGRTSRINITNDSLICPLDRVWSQTGLIFGGIDEKDSVKHLLVQNNYFKGPHTGVFMWDYGNSFYPDSIRILDNEFHGFLRALDLAQLDGLEVRRNRIKVDSFTWTQTIGIWVRYCYDGIFDANDIDISGEVQLIGIWFDNRGNLQRDRMLQIVNNTISINDYVRGNGSSHGMIFDYVDSAQIAHNSVNLASQDTFGAAVTFGLYSKWPSTIYHYNNSYKSQGRARVLQMWSDSISIFLSDNNNYSSNLSKYFKINNKVMDLAGVQSVEKMDSNSVTVDPDYFDFYDLHTNSPYLDNAGRALTPSVPHDMDGDLRPSAQPSIGADEYVYYALDLDVLDIYPKTYCSGNSDVYLQVKNTGEDTIKAMNISWQNETAFSGNEVDYNSNWSGAMMPGDSGTIYLGTTKLSSDSSSILRFRIDSLNHIANFQKRNNTHISDTIRPAMAGEYTIGDTLSNFKSVMEAVRTMESKGICDSVRFLIRDGVYNEQIEIGKIPGVSKSRAIEFVSHPDNKKPARLVYAPNSSNSDYVIKFSDAKRITFDSLSIQNIASGYGGVIYIKGKNDYLTFSHDSIISSNGAPSNEHIVIEQEDVAWTGQYLNHFKLTYSVIRGGNVQVHMGTLRTGNPKSRHSIMEHNEFVDFRNIGLRMYQVDSFYFGHNLISSIDSGQESRGALSWNYSRIGAVHDNQVEIFARIPTGFSFNLDSGTTSQPFRIYNNRIIVRNWASGVQNTYTGGIVLDRGEYINIEHNNIKVDAGKERLNGIYLSSTYGGPTKDLYLRNNVLAAFGKAECLFTSFYASDLTSDYNGWYSENYLATWGKKKHTSLSSIQAMSTDANSVYGNPGFYGQYDLHTNSKSLNGKALVLTSYKYDMDGETRDPNIPDIGADEMNRQIHDLALKRFITKEIDFCGSVAQDISVVIKNQGTFDEKRYKTRLLVSGPTNDTIVKSVSTNIDLATTDTIVFGTVDLRKKGSYTIRAIVELANDSVRSNDTIEMVWNTKTYTKPIVPDYVGCLNESYFIFLKAPSGYGGYRWFADSTSTKILGSDSNYRVVALKNTDSFYVEIDPPLNESVGPKDPTIGNTYQASDYGLGLKFDVFDDVIIDSVTAYLSSAGDVVINILDSSARTIFSERFKASSSGQIELPLNALIPPGKDYIINAYGSTVSAITKNTSGAGFGYNDPRGLMRIKSDQSGGLNDYNFFYNWKVKLPVCYEGRIKVRAVLKKNPDNPKVVVDSVCSGETIAFATNSNDNTASWYRKEYDTKSAWEGDTFRVQNLTAPYTVFVQNDSSNGCSSRRISSTGYPISIPSQPITRDTFACESDSLTISSSDSSQWYWYKSFDATQVDFKGVNYRAEVAKYDTIWVAKQNQGCEGMRSAIAIDKRQIPKLPKIEGQTSLCIGDTLYLKTENGELVKWSDESKTTVKTDSSLVLIDSKIGDRPILIEIDSLGCKSAGRVDYQIKPLPSQFELLYDSVCPGDDATLYVNTNSKVRWFGSDTSTSALTLGNTFVDSSSQGLTYYFELDSLTCTSSRFEAQAIVDSAFIPVIDAINGDEGCEGDTISGFAESNNSQIHWFEDILLEKELLVGNNLIVNTISESGMYYVQGQNAYCKGSVDSARLTINPLPDADFTYTINAEKVSLESSASKSGIEYKWLLPDGADFGSSIIWEIHSDGTYDISLIAKDSLSLCPDTVTKSIEIRDLGVSQVFLNDGLKVYPIPNRTEFTISLDRIVAGEYFLYDLSGREALRGELMLSGTTIVSHRVNKGSYQLVVRTESKTWVRRIIVY